MLHGRNKHILHDIEFKREFSAPIILRLFCMNKWAKEFSIRIHSKVIIDYFVPNFNPGSH